MGVSCIAYLVARSDTVDTQIGSGSALLLLVMGHGVVWEPSTKKEVAYYDKLFQAVDRDESGTLDGKETVQFLGHSGLTKNQLKVLTSTKCAFRI